MCYGEQIHRHIIWQTVIQIKEHGADVSLNEMSHLSGLASPDKRHWSIDGLREHADTWDED